MMRESGCTSWATRTTKRTPESYHRATTTHSPREEAAMRGSKQKKREGQRWRRRRAPGDGGRSFIAGHTAPTATPDLHRKEQYFI